MKTFIYTNLTNNYSHFKSDEYSILTLDRNNNPIQKSKRVYYEVNFLIYEILPILRNL